MRSDDDFLVNYFIEQVGNRVGSILIRSTESDKITLKNAFGTWQIVKAFVEDFCNVPRVVSINILVRFVDLNLHFIEDRFGANEEISRGRINSPNDSGSAIDFGGKINLRLERLQERSVTREDGIFGVFDVKVLSHD